VNRHEFILALVGAALVGAALAGPIAAVAQQLTGIRASAS